MGDGEEGDLEARTRRATSAFAHFATRNAALLKLMDATKRQPGTADVTRAADAAFAPFIELIREGQETQVLREGSVEEIGLVLYATTNGLTTLVNNGFVDADRLDALTGAAVDQS